FLSRRRVLAFLRLTFSDRNEPRKVHPPKFFIDSCQDSDSGLETLAWNIYYKYSFVRVRTLVHIINGRHLFRYHLIQKFFCSLIVSRLHTLHPLALRYAAEI